MADSVTPSLENTRRLYESVLDWYKNADAKAQVVLSLAGIFLTFVGTTLLKDAANVVRLPWYSFALLALMCLALTLSLFHAILCIWSRTYNPVELTDFLNKAGVDPSRHETYAPSVCWFFQTVSSLNKAQFEKKMQALERTFEVDAMSSQIYELSVRVTKKHHHVNYGFSFAAITFLLFLASGVSLLIP